MNVELSKSTWEDIISKNPEVAILPWGSIEVQGNHLPYGADSIEAENIAKISTQLANEKGAKAIVLPTISYGINTAQLDVPFTISIKPSTQLLILKDIVGSLEKQGIKKLILINGHGGNQFVPHIRELYLESKVFICLVNTNQVVSTKDYFEIVGEHADERATSVLMHLCPDLVRENSDTNFEAKKFKIEELNQGWAWAQRNWTSVTESNIIGNPEKATKEKGEKYINAICNKISTLIVNISKAKLEDLYQ